MAGKGNKKQITLTQSLAAFLGKTLLPDLKARAGDEAVDGALKRQWEAEKAAKRTADGYPAWRDRTLEQIGAAWVLSCVFVRTLEDRDLLARRRLAGQGALDSEQLFFEVAPSLTARDYLLTVFREVASLPGAEELLGVRHNPLWRLGPSAAVARELLGFFRQEDEKGELVWRFDGADTRFLGDLYQDLSEDVRKRYALLQTPDFVERFILGETLDPAIAEFGLDQVRVIDPTCGSGHFLLGAFDRLLTLRLQKAPGVDVRDHAAAAIGQVYGVDVNPYAVAIARFRLTLAYLQRTGITKLAQAPRLALNLVVADSLLHGGGKGTELLLVEQDNADIDRVAWQESMFALDDEFTGRKILRQRYHAVVGNPPYITCKDSALREVYRERYRSAAGKYALAAPFTERFFELAVDDGFVGLINANSFMKREFGKKLIEEVLPEFELTSVLDTSGAYIPGHGTPTVLLFGRNRKSVAASVHAVLGKRGEPSTPGDAEQGLVWRSIADHGREVGFENEYVSVADVARENFAKHPWSLGGGGAADLKELIEERRERTLGDVATSIGIASFTLEDDVYLAPESAYLTVGIPKAARRPMVIGEVVRDWSIGETPWAFFPYDEELVPIVDHDRSLRHLWPYRTSLANNKLFGGKTKVEGGLKWYEYGRLTVEKLRTPLTIAFAEVATHNHFVLDRGGKVFKQTAPIIKLPESATEDDHLALLAYLNSSTACFYLKQTMMSKGGSGIGRGIQDESWESRFQFDGTKMKMLPLPDTRALCGLGRAADEAAKQVQESSPRSALHLLLKGGGIVDLKAELLTLCDQRAVAHMQLVGIQEAIDWIVYGLFGITHIEQTRDAGSLAENQRPFEFQLGERLKTGEPTSWFERHQRTPSNIHPEGKAFADRLREIDENPLVAFIERPDFKRRFYPFSWEQETNDACAETFLDACEGIQKGSTASSTSVRRLIGDALSNSKIRQVADLLSSGDEIVLAKQVAGESVPFISHGLFTNQGLEKHAVWRHTWSLQRREDLGEAVGEIPVPPKYDQKDFRDANYWRLRGKLDVPKERFIFYPGCQKDGDPSPLIGWAGWNHLQRAQALVALYQERKTEDAWPKERLMPMLVGLHELMFWLDLWHNNPEVGSQNPAREFKQFLDAELHAHALTPEDLEAWRPMPAAKEKLSAVAKEKVRRPSRSSVEATE